MIIPIDLENIEASLTVANEALTTWNAPIDEQTKYKVAFICEEIITNLARHANFEERKPDVSLTYVFAAPDTLQLYFKDNSKHFNLLEFPDPDLNSNLNDTETGGLGIFLTKKYAKTLQSNYENGYNILKVVL